MGSGIIGTDTWNPSLNETRAGYHKRFSFLAGNSNLIQMFAHVRSLKGRVRSKASWGCTPSCQLLCSALALFPACMSGSVESGTVWKIFMTNPVADFGAKSRTLVSGQFHRDIRHRVEAFYCKLCVWGRFKGFQIPSDQRLDQFVSMERVSVWEVWFKFHACFCLEFALIQVLTGPTSFEEELPKCPDSVDVEMLPRKGIENQAMICEVVHDVNSITQCSKRSPIYSVEQTCHHIEILCVWPSFQGPRGSHDFPEFLQIGRFVIFSKRGKVRWWYQRYLYMYPLKN